MSGESDNKSKGLSNFTIFSIEDQKEDKKNEKSEEEGPMERDEKNNEGENFNDRGESHNNIEINESVKIKVSSCVNPIKTTELFQKIYGKLRIPNNNDSIFCCVLLTYLIPSCFSQDEEEFNMRFYKLFMPSFLKQHGKAALLFNTTYQIDVWIKKLKEELQGSVVLHKKGKANRYTEYNLQSTEIIFQLAAKLRLIIIKAIQANLIHLFCDPEFYPNSPPDITENLRRSLLADQRGGDAVIDIINYEKWLDNRIKIRKGELKDSDDVQQIYLWTEKKDSEKHTEDSQNQKKDLHKHYDLLVPKVMLSHFPLMGKNKKGCCTNFYKFFINTRDQLQIDQNWEYFQAFVAFACAVIITIVGAVNLLVTGLLPDNLVANFVLATLVFLTSGITAAVLGLFSRDARQEPARMEQRAAKLINAQEVGEAEASTQIASKLIKDFSIYEPVENLASRRQFLQNVKTRQSHQEELRLLASDLLINSKNKSKPLTHDELNKAHIQLNYR